MPADDLAARFAAAGVEPTRPVVTTCGSGVTACVLALGLHLIGRDDVAVGAPVVWEGWLSLGVTTLVAAVVAERVFAWIDLP